MNENGLVNVHKQVNKIQSGELDNTFKYRTKCIDVVFCTYRLIEFVSGCQMTECDEVILNDHRGYLVDIEIERYCQCKLNKFDRLNHTILDNTRKSHMERFSKKINELMQSLILRQKVVDLKYIRSQEVFNIIDDLFTKNTK
jgi:hypothetical protein